MLEIIGTLAMWQLVTYGVIGAFVGWLIGRRKKQVFSGTFWGLLFGPIGWIIVLALPHRGRKCPFCKGLLASDDALKCVNCGSEVPPEETPVKTPKKRPAKQRTGIRPPGKRLR